MQQEFRADQTGTDVPTSPTPDASAYEVPEGRGELFNRNFILLLIGQTASYIGDSFFTTTLLVWVLTVVQAGPGSPASKTAAIAGTSSAILSALLLPLVFGPFTGVFVDRWNRKWTMIVSDLAQAVATLLPLAAFAFFSSALLPAIVVSVFLLNSCATVFLPSQFGALQVIVSKRKLTQAISLAQLLVGIGGLIGPLIASPLFVKFGPTAAILGNSVSFLISALCLSLIRVPRRALRPYSARTVERVSLSQSLLKVWRELVEGLRYIFTTRILAILAISLIIAQLGVGGINTLGTLYFTQYLHGSPALYGPFQSAFGLGVLLGAAVSGLVARKLSSRYIVMIGFLGLGIFLLLYALDPTFAFLGAALLVAGFITIALLGISQGAFQVGYLSVIVDTAPKTIIGRAHASLSAVAIAAEFTIIILAGIVGGIVSLSLFFGLGALLLIIAGLLGIVAVRQLRQKELQEATAASTQVEAAVDTGASSPAIE